MSGEQAAKKEMARFQQSISEGHKASQAVHHNVQEIVEDMKMSLSETLLGYEREVELIEKKMLAGVQSRLGIKPYKASKILRRHSNRASRAAVLEAKDLPAAVAYITPFAWPWLFYHALFLLGGTFIFFLYVYFRIVAPCLEDRIHKTSLPTVPLWVPLAFTPVILFLIPFEVRAFRIIIPAVFRFADKPKFFGMRIWLPYWIIIQIIEGLIDRFEYATTVITFCRMQGAYGTPIEHVFNKVYHIPMHAAVAIAFTFFWFPKIVGFVYSLPFPACIRNWLPPRGTMPAVKPFGLCELLCVHVKQPYSQAVGGFFGICGGRVYVLTSMVGIANSSKAGLVSWPMEALQQKLEIDRVGTDSGTRRQVSRMIFLSGFKTASRVWGSAFWLYVKCCLITVVGYFRKDDHIDTMILAGIVFSTLSFLHATAETTAQIVSRYQALAPHIDKLEQGVYDEATGEYIYKEQPSERTSNKCHAYIGLAMHFVSEFVAVLIFGYSFFMLYHGVFTCNVRPWTVEDGCITSA